jgi:hypothetical protein
MSKRAPLADMWYVYETHRRRILAHSRAQNVPKTKVEQVKLVEIAKARKKLERAEYIY